MPRTKQRTGDLRDRILYAALEILAVDGPMGVTTRRVAELAATSPPAIYELFNDKPGLIRALYFEGFRRLETTLRHLPSTDDPVADVSDVVVSLRSFALSNSSLFGLMYSRSFETFSPGRAEREIGDSTRRIIVERVDRCVQSDRLVGDPTDIAHALLAVAIGLATQEIGGWLGGTTATREMRWRLSVDALVRGFSLHTG